MRFPWFIVLLAFVMPVAHGDTVLKNVEIHVDLDKGEERIFISVESDREAFIPIRGKDIQLMENVESVIIKEGGIVVLPGRHEIKVLGRAESRLAGKEHFYYKDVGFPFPVEHLLLIIKLPENSFPDVTSANLPLENSDDLTVMPDYVNIEDNHVVLIWKRALRKNETFYVGIFYPVANKSTYSMIVILMLIPIILLSPIYYFMIKKKNKKIGDMIPAFMKMKRKDKKELTDDEELILSLIKARGGVALQEDIWKAERIKFSRPKVSQILAKLENRGIIRREPFKRTYKVYITDENMF